MTILLTAIEKNIEKFCLRLNKKNEREDTSWRNKSEKELLVFTFEVTYLPSRQTPPVRHSWNADLSSVVLVSKTVKIIRCQVLTVCCMRKHWKAKALNCIFCRHTHSHRDKLTKMLNNAHVSTATMKWRYRTIRKKLFYLDYEASQRRQNFVSLPSCVVQTAP